MRYCRYYAKGGIPFTPAGGETCEATGDMIYEYAYMGQPDPAAHVKITKPWQALCLPGLSIFTSEV